MVVHRNGKSHSNADALSRRPSEDLETSHIAAIDITEPFVEKLKGMRKKQLEDSSIGPVLRARDAKEFPGKDELKAYSIDTRRLFQIWDQLEVKHMGYSIASLLELVVGVLVCNWWYQHL